MSVNIEELRRLANEATPGPWYLRTNRHRNTDGTAWGWLDTQQAGDQNPPAGVNVTWSSGRKSDSNAMYLAAANPATILALLDDLERVKAQRDAYLNLLSDVAYEVESLISESYGIAGLHMNGDIAPWHEIEVGGQYERLTNLPLAIEAARAAKEPQP